MMDSVGKITTNNLCAAKLWKLWDSIITSLDLQYSELPERVSHYTRTQRKTKWGRKLGLGFCTNVYLLWGWWHDNLNIYPYNRMLIVTCDPHLIYSMNSIHPTANLHSASSIKSLRACLRDALIRYNMTLLANRSAPPSPRLRGSSRRGGLGTFLYWPKLLFLVPRRVAVCLDSPGEAICR